MLSLGLTRTAECNHVHGAAHDGLEVSPQVFEQSESPEATGVVRQIDDEVDIAFAISVATGD